MEDLAQLENVEPKLRGLLCVEHGQWLVPGIKAEQSLTIAAQQILTSCLCRALRPSNRYQDSRPLGTASLGKHTATVARKVDAE